MTVGCGFGASSATIWSAAERWTLRTVPVPLRPEWKSAPISRARPGCRKTGRRVPLLAVGYDTLFLFPLVFFLISRNKMRQLNKKIKNKTLYNCRGCPSGRWSVTIWPTRRGRRTSCARASSGRRRSAAARPRWPSAAPRRPRTPSRSSTITRPRYRNGGPALGAL